MSQSQSVLTVVVTADGRVFLYFIMTDDANQEKKKMRRCIGDCNKYNNYRLRLRQCKHCICLECAIRYLNDRIQNDKNNVRIKCPKYGCRQYIHENDIVALLDISMSDSDKVMRDCNRGWLQRYHDRCSIIRAFNGKLRSCPNCQVCLLSFDSVICFRISFPYALDATLFNAANVEKSFVSHAVHKRIVGSIFYQNRVDSVGMIFGE